MKKKILRRGTLLLPCNQAKPGASLSSWGINMPAFCRDFNAKTSDQEPGKLITVKIEVFDDKSYNLEIKGAPTSILLKNLIKNRSEKFILDKELDEIAQIKMKDSNSDNLENVKKSILGTMKSSGIVMKD